MCVSPNFPSHLHCAHTSYHPSQDSSEEAAYKFKQLSNAFELLSNTPMRRRYDEALAAQPQVDGSPSGHVVPSDFKFSDSLAVFDRVRCAASARGEAWRGSGCRGPPHIRALGAVLWGAEGRRA